MMPWVCAETGDVTEFVLLMVRVYVPKGGHGGVRIRKSAAEWAAIEEEKKRAAAEKNQKRGEEKEADRKEVNRWKAKLRREKKAQAVFLESYLVQYGLSDEQRYYMLFDTYEAAVGKLARRGRINDAELASWCRGVVADTFPLERFALETRNRADYVEVLAFKSALALAQHLVSFSLISNGIWRPEN